MHEPSAGAFPVKAQSLLRQDNAQKQRDSALLRFGEKQMRARDTRKDRLIQRAMHV
jgi:hypothetical protein